MNIRRTSHAAFDSMKKKQSLHKKIKLPVERYDGRYYLVRAKPPVSFPAKNQTAQSIPIMMSARRRIRPPISIDSHIKARASSHAYQPRNSCSVCTLYQSGIWCAQCAVSKKARGRKWMFQNLLPDLVRKVLKRIASDGIH